MPLNEITGGNSEAEPTDDGMANEGNVEDDDDNIDDDPDDQAHSVTTFAPETEVPITVELLRYPATKVEPAEIAARKGEPGPRLVNSD